MNLGLPDVPDWVPLEEYGVGVPFTLMGAGLGALVYAFPGIRKMETLTQYGRFGLLVIVLIAVALIAMAGYTYSQIDHSWWLKTRESDDG